MLEFVNQQCRLRCHLQSRKGSSCPHSSWRAPGPASELEEASLGLHRRACAGQVPLLSSRDPDALRAPPVARLARMKPISERLQRQHRLYALLGGVILATLPCYCLGVILLELRLGPSATATPFFQPTTTPSPTAPPTATPTSIRPPTATSAPQTPYLTPTNTFTPSPVPSPTFTPRPTATPSLPPSATPQATESGTAAAP